MSDPLMPQVLPETRGDWRYPDLADRVHVLDRSCWCGPVEEARPNGWFLIHRPSLSGGSVDEEARS
jgi:hypothetical protein